MVMTVSNIHQMFESSKVEGEGTSTAAGSANSSTIESPVKEGGGGANRKAQP